MRCHWTTYEGQRIFIPGCMGSAVYGAYRCTCDNDLTFAQFEKKEYNVVLNKKNNLIKELQSENNRLNRILKRFIPLPTKN